MTGSRRIYDECVVVPSSRRIATMLNDDIGFRALAANNTTAPYQVRRDVISAPSRTFARNIWRRCLGCFYPPQAD